MHSQQNIKICVFNFAKYWRASRCLFARGCKHCSVLTVAVGSSKTSVRYNKELRLSEQCGYEADQNVNITATCRRHHQPNEISLFAKRGTGPIR